VPRHLTLVFALLLSLVAVASAAPFAPPRAAVDFGSDDGILELKAALTPTRGPASHDGGAPAWYMMTAANNSERPVSRIIIADQPPNEGLRIFPTRARPAVLNIASSDAEVLVEHARSVGRHAFRVTIPAATSATLALQVAYADPQPSVLAWAEPALVSHNRQLAVFFAAVAGLIAAATAIMIGLAVMTAHPAPRWAALTLSLVFLTRLGETGMFDTGWATVVGGPFGFQAMLEGFALAAGLRLTDVIAPIEGLWAPGRLWLDRGIILLLVISVLAFLGFPGTTLLTGMLVVAGTAAAAAYLVHSGRLGQQAARVAAPSAAVFALVATAGAIAALGGFQDNPAAPGIIGGFAAAGAVLLALAIAAGEGIAILPANRATPVPQTSGATRAADAASADAAAPSAALQAIGASHQGVFDLNLRNDVVELSSEASVLIGFKLAQTMRHVVWIDRIHPEDRDIYRAAIGDYRGHPGIAFRIELRVRSESGRYPWFELRATMMGEGAEADRCLGLMADVTTRKEAEAAAIDRTTRDALTGLGNRVALMEELEQLGARLSGVTFALLDVDRFKAIHASLGDAGGDAVLVAISQRLVTRFKDVAEVFRVRGDAFALVFPMPGAGAAAIGAELVEVCRAPILHEGRNIFAPASAGVVAGRDARDSLELLKNAELALNQAKRAGGACARVYAAAMEALAPGDPVVLETELRKALEQDQLDIFYQPIVRLADGSVAGFEALLRWHHPAKGLVSPADFVAHSEETGLIVELGRFSLVRAADDLAHWQKFFPLEPPLFASVNLSRRQLQDKGFAQFLGDLLAKNGIVPSTLKLEVTEGAVAGNADVVAALAEIRATGAGLAIDDFGTGLSSLSQLKDIPFDTVKIDRSFLALHGSSHEEGDGAVILGSIVNLAHELGRSVVVEGVENAQDVARLNQMGCEFAQGFYYSPPMPRADALNYIARHCRVAANSGVSGVG
jgi:diguanylate cyclase (GGDEF)-like protein/PAS domain S-box-containing protein